MHGYSQYLRNKAMDLYVTDNYNKKELAELLSLGYATVRRWIDRYNETGSCLIIKPEHECRRSIFTDKQAVLDYLQEYPDANGIELRNKLAAHLSQSCFYNTLNRMGITYKKEVNYPQRCEQKIALFAKQIKSISPDKLVYIDETGVDNNLSKLRGWSLK